MHLFSTIKLYENTNIYIISCLGYFTMFVSTTFRKKRVNVVFENDVLMYIWTRFFQYKANKCFEAKKIRIFPYFRKHYNYWTAVIFWYIWTSIFSSFLCNSLFNFALNDKPYQHVIIIINIRSLSTSLRINHNQCLTKYKILEWWSLILCMIVLLQLLSLSTKFVTKHD